MEAHARLNLNCQVIGSRLHSHAACRKRERVQGGSCQPQGGVPCGPPGYTCEEQGGGQLIPLLLLQRWSAGGLRPACCLPACRNVVKRTSCWEGHWEGPTSPHWPPARLCFAGPGAHLPL